MFVKLLRLPNGVKLRVGFFFFFLHASAGFCCLCKTTLF